MCDHCDGIRTLVSCWVPKRFNYNEYPRARTTGAGFFFLFPIDSFLLISPPPHLFPLRGRPENRTNWINFSHSDRHTFSCYYDRSLSARSVCDRCTCCWQTVWRVQLVVRIGHRLLTSNERSSYDKSIQFKRNFSFLCTYSFETFPWTVTIPVPAR